MNEAQEVGIDPNYFGFHKLNNDGQEKAQKIQLIFENCLAELQQSIEVNGREFAICKTKLEEACFFAKKAMAVQKKNQV